MSPEPSLDVAGVPSSSRWSAVCSAEPVAEHVISFAALMEARPLVSAPPVVTVITSLRDMPRGITRRHSTVVELELLPTGDAPCHCLLGVLIL